MGGGGGGGDGKIQTNLRERGYNTENVNNSPHSSSFGSIYVREEDNYWTVISPVGDLKRQGFVKSGTIHDHMIGLPLDLPFQTPRNFPAGFRAFRVHNADGKERKDLIRWISRI